MLQGHSAEEREHDGVETAESMQRSLGHPTPIAEDASPYPSKGKSRRVALGATRHRVPAFASWCIH